MVGDKDIANLRNKGTAPIMLQVELLPGETATVETGEDGKFIAVMKATADSHDVIEWPDESWCFRYELHEMTHMSDDYKVYAYNSSEWFDFMKREDAQ